MNPFQAKNLLQFAYLPENFSQHSNPQMSSLRKKIQEISFFRDVHHRNLTSFRPQDYACAFTPGDNRKSYAVLLFCLPRIKVKYTPQDKVK